MIFKYHEHVKRILCPLGPTSAYSPWYIAWTSEKIKWTWIVPGLS